MPALTWTEGAWAPANLGGLERPRFCSRCGQSEDDAQPAAHPRRVCGGCGMGMLLACAPDALPGPEAPFLVVTAELEVSAVSRKGEGLFGRERTVLGKPLLDVVSSPVGDEMLAHNVEHAALRDRPAATMPVRLASKRRASGVGTLAARIDSCGPPRGALLAVEPTGFGRR
jgi:hypothetical protein